MTPAFIVRVWLVFGTLVPSDASQTVKAIPFASFQDCERGMDRKLAELSSVKVTIKPFCTTVAPPFWIRVGEF